MKTVFFGTLHEKGALVGPALEKAGYQIRAVSIDSDSLGTFSGERERLASIREVLRQKIQMVRAQVPQGRFFLASEGSFGPHPRLPFVSSDLEVLLWFDAVTNQEIAAEAIAVDRLNREWLLTGDRQEVGAVFARLAGEVGFPDQAMIVTLRDAGGRVVGVHKDLRSIAELWRAYDELVGIQERSQANDSPVKLILTPDLRANRSPFRQSVIGKAALHLASLLQSNCPQCKAPGWRAVAGEPGRPCEECHSPTELAQAEIWECSVCLHSERRKLEAMAPSAECAECNP